MVSASAKSVTGLVPKVGSCPAWAQGPLCFQSRLGSLPPDPQHHPQTRSEGVSKHGNMFLPFCCALSLGCLQCQRIPSYPALLSLILTFFKHPETLQNSVMNTHMS